VLPEAWTLLVLSCTYIYGNEGRLDLGQIAEGDKVVTRLTAVGNHEGDLPGAPRTGNDLQMTSITIHRIVGGKLVEK
jgi:hypothetical protein